MPERLAKLSRRILLSPYFIPVLFLLSQYPLWIGKQSMMADGGDGIAAFKFFHGLPFYWNWFENGGQPFWFDVGAYRILDPLHWPLLLLVKLSHLPTLIAYNVFLLLRFTAIALGLAFLLDEIGVGRWQRQIVLLLACFGSLIPTFYRSIGMADTLFTLVFSLLFGLRFLRRGEKWDLYLLTLFLLQSALSYHVLYLVPLWLLLVALAMMLYRESFLQAVNRAWRMRGRVVFCAFCLALALAAGFRSGTSPDLIPALRNLRYNTVVDDKGTSVTPNGTQGRSVFDVGSLRSRASACRKSEPCREYELWLARSLVHMESFYSLTLYLTIAGLILFLLCVIGVRLRLFWICFLATAFAFVLSLGNQTPLWVAVQTFLPPLHLVRHTGFYASIALFGVLVSLGVGLTDLEKTQTSHRWIQSITKSKPLPLFLFAAYAACVLSEVPRAFWAKSFAFQLAFAAAALFFLAKRRYHACIATCLLWECFSFQFVIVRSFNAFTTKEQRDSINASEPTAISVRQRRILNYFSVPRSSAGTAYGIATAMEPIHCPYGNPAQAAPRFFDPHYFGFITPFLYPPAVKARLFAANNREAFDRIFGVFPYPIVSFYRRGAAHPFPPDPKLALEEIAKGALLTHTASRLATPDVAPTPSASPLQIHGDSLSLEVSGREGDIAYVSLPFEAIHDIESEGRALPFEKANHFGIAVKIPPGARELIFHGDTSQRDWLILLFFGSYLLLSGGSVFELLVIERRRAHTELGLAQKA